MKTKKTDCLYEITEFYISEGYDAEQAEEMAWKSVQGGGISIPDETIEPDIQPTKQTVNFDYVPIPF